MGRTKIFSYILVLLMLLIMIAARSALAMDVTLAWDANSEPNLAGYKIYYDRDSGAPYSGTGATAGKSPITMTLTVDENPDPNVVQFTVKNLPNGDYYFSVTAFNREGIESGYSNEAYVTNGWTPGLGSSDADGDGIADSYEIFYGLNASSASDRHLDSDKDGYNNYQEYLYGTAPNDADSFPEQIGIIDVVESLPLDFAGVPPSLERIPNNTAFAVRVETSKGFDMTDPDAASFSIKDGDRTYTRKLNDKNKKGSELLRAIPLYSEKNIAYSFWLVYYRSLETAIPDLYAHDATVEVTIKATDIDGEAMEPAVFSFKIQGKARDDAAKLKVPVLTTVQGTDSNKTVRVDSGPLKGASITFDKTLLDEIGMEPYFGPADEIPPLNAAQAVSAPLNLLPPAIFPDGVTLTIPCPGYQDPSELSLYYFDGDKWLLACDGAGNMTADGHGWMVPGSRVNHAAEGGNPAYIEVQVYHFSAAVAADSPVISSGGGAGAESGGGGGGCFISSLGGK